MSNKVLEKVIDYVAGCFERDAPDYLYYHNMNHTRTVVLHATEIGNAYQLNEADKHNLIIAAWFHDLGHLYTTPEHHEDKSIALMSDFLQTECSADSIRDIKKIINATKSISIPETILEKIIRDADSYHFGTPLFRITDKLVKMEMEKRTGHALDNWTQHSLLILKKHQYFTAYCQEVLHPGKQENIAFLENQILTGGSSIPGAY